MGGGGRELQHLMLGAAGSSPPAPSHGLSLSLCVSISPIFLSVLLSVPFSLLCPTLPFSLPLCKLLLSPSLSGCACWGSRVGVGLGGISHSLFTSAALSFFISSPKGSPPPACVCFCVFLSFYVFFLPSSPSRCLFFFVFLVPFLCVNLFPFSLCTFLSVPVAPLTCHLSLSLLPPPGLVPLSLHPYLLLISTEKPGTSDQRASSSEEG